jgi:DNA replication protein DnaC
MNQIFPDFERATLDNFECLTPSLEKAVTIARDYLDQQLYQSGLGITFMGPSGVGKTHLACATLREMRTQHEYIELSTWIEMHTKLFRLTTRNLDEEKEQASKLDRHLDRVKAVGALLLDDLGREHESMSGWSSERVFDLVRYRRNRQDPTLLTTNLRESDLDVRYTEGFFSYLRQATIIVVMEGEDYRCGMGR